MQGRLGVGHRFDHSDIRAENALEQVLAVAGQRQRSDVSEASRADVPEERLGVLDRIALGLGVGYVQ